MIRRWMKLEDAEAADKMASLLGYPAPSILSWVKDPANAGVQWVQLAFSMASPELLDILGPDPRGFYRLWSTLYLSEEGLVDPLVRLAAAAGDFVPIPMATHHRMFITPQGQTGQGKCSSLDFYETNMLESGRVASGRAFAVSWIEVSSNKVLPEGLSLQWDLLNTRLDIGVLGPNGGDFPSDVQLAGYTTFAVRVNREGPLTQPGTAIRCILHGQIKPFATFTSGRLDASGKRP